MRLLMLATLLSIPFLATAQYSESMSSDRPGQSISPNTVGKNVLQIQGGYVYDNYESENRFFNYQIDYDNLEIMNYGNVKVRYGVFDKTEVSAQVSLGGINSQKDFKVDPQTVITPYPNEDEEKTDIIDYGFGIRQNILNEPDNGVSLGVEAEYLISESGTDYLHFTVSVARQFFEKLSLTANAGYFIDGDLFFTANVGYQVIDDLGVYVEYFPVIGERALTDEDFQFLNSIVNAGLFYQLTPNFMLDATAGFLASDIERNDNVDISNYSIQIGFTSRLDWRK